MVDSLYADVHDRIVEHAMKLLERIVDAGKKNGRLDYLLHEPKLTIGVRGAVVLYFPRLRPCGQAGIVCSAQCVVMHPEFLNLVQVRL